MLIIGRSCESVNYLLSIQIQLMHFVSEGNILNWLTKAIFYPGHVMPTNVVFKPDGAPKRSLRAFSVAGFYSVAFFFSSFSSIRHILISYFTFQIKILEKSTFKKIPPKSISSKVLLHLRFSPFDKSSQIKMPKEKLMLVMLHCRRRCCCCCLPSFKERRNWLSFVPRRPGSYWDQPPEADDG